MAKSGNGISTAQVYGLVNETRKELASSISTVETKVDKVTTDVANIQGKITVIAAIISIAISGFFLVINILLKK